MPNSEPIFSVGFMKKKKIVRFFRSKIISLSLDKIILLSVIMFLFHFRAFSLKFVLFFFFLIAKFQFSSSALAEFYFRLNHFYSLVHYCSLGVFFFLVFHTRFNLVPFVKRKSPIIRNLFFRHSSIFIFSLEIVHFFYFHFIRSSILFQSLFQSHFHFVTNCFEKKNSKIVSSTNGKNYSLVIHDENIISSLCCCFFFSNHFLFFSIYFHFGHTSITNNFFFVSRKIICNSM